MNYLEEYIDLLIEKDESAFTYIYQETNAAVYAMIRSVIKDRQLAEDVMQETYMKMIRSIHSYQRGRNFKNWLLTIAKNTAISEYRKRKHEYLVDSEDLDYMVDNKSEAPSVDLDMDQLLAILSEEERQIVLLRIVDNMKHKDIAELMNKPLGTVLWIYQKAIKKMQKERKGLE